MTAGPAAYCARYRYGVLMPPNHCPGGFSLIACLIANGLALALVASLFSASADLLVAVRESSLRSDQVLRARQFFLFVSEALSSAKIPEHWVPADVSTSSSAVWPLPRPPCESPAGALKYQELGGVSVVNPDELDCLFGGEGDQALYIEQVLPCPDRCGGGSGWVVYPRHCGTLFRKEALLIEWEIAWQPHMEQPQQCEKAAPWGRLQRLLLSGAEGRGVDRGPTLRLRRVSGKVDYHWQPPESLVNGVEAWHVYLLPRVEEGQSAADTQAPGFAALSLSLDLGSADAEHTPPSVSVSRLLVP